MSTVKTRIAKLECTGFFDPPPLPARTVIVGPRETEAEAYHRTYDEQMPPNVEEIYRMMFILLVEAGPRGGPPDPSDPKARCRPGSRAGMAQEN